MKIGSLNVNGINAFGRSRCPGASEYFDFYSPDILCLQEVKGDITKLYSSIGDLVDSFGYTPFVSSSKGKNGYAGVGMLIKSDILDKYSPEITSVELLDQIDASNPIYNDFKYYGTGRILILETKDFYVISVYTLNSCSKEDLRKLWDIKFKEYLKSLDWSKSIYILGDLNVCHTKLDMWDWSRSLNTAPGLMQFEIDGFSNLLSELNLVDTFRYLNGDSVGYTWSAPRAPLSSRGWRLDYALTNKIETVTKSSICSEIRCSDHVYIEIEVNQ